MFTELQIAITSGLFSILGWGLADFFAKKTVDKIDIVTDINLLTKMQYSIW